MTIQEKNQIVEYMFLHDRGSSMSLDWRQGFLSKLDEMCGTKKEHQPDAMGKCKSCGEQYCAECFKDCPQCV